MTQERSVKTESETLFEKFCNMHGILFKSIPCEKDERTPDYEIIINNQKIIVEVKQIDPNEQEIKKTDELRERKSVIMDTIPGGRVRGKISDASGKFRKYSEGKYPSILVLYNKTNLFNHLYDYQILVGMYGFETHVLSVPKVMGKPPNLIIKKFGPKKKLTKTDNTSISAIVVLDKNDKGDPVISIYHNFYAEIPLDPALFYHLSVKQFRLQNAADVFQSWCEIN